MFNDLGYDGIVAHAMEKGLGEVEACELATLATQRCVDSTREDFERYWFLVEMLGR